MLQKLPITSCGMALTFNHPLLVHSHVAQHVLRALCSLIQHRPAKRSCIGAAARHLHCSALRHSCRVAARSMVGSRQQGARHLVKRSSSAQHAMQGPAETGCDLVSAAVTNWPRRITCIYVAGGLPRVRL